MVDRIEFDGNKSFSSTELKRVIKLKEPFLFRSSEFNRRSLKLDAITLRNFYISKGFPEATVEESFSVSDANRVDVLFIIKEGDRSFLRSVEIDGSTLLGDELIMNILGLEAGKPFNPIRLRQGLPDLEREYGKLGKLLVLFDPSYVPEREIHLTLSITEGPTVKIDKIIIDGLSRVDSTIVLRELKISEDTVYDAELVELTQRQIFETGLFSLVDILPLKSSRGENWVNVRVEVREFHPREILAEIDISRIPTSSDGGEPLSGLGPSVQGFDRSIFGTGARVGVKSTVQFPLEDIGGVFRKVRYEVDLTMSRLWINRWRAPYTLRVFARREPDLVVTDEYVTRYGGQWHWVHRFSEKSLLRGGLSWARIIATQKDPTEEKDENAREQERGFSLSYRYRQVDDPIIPTRGTDFSVGTSVVGWILGGTQDYYKIEADYRKYLPFGSSRVFAFRTKLGWMERLPGTRTDSIPSYDRFYLGGSTSLRGWESQRLQVDDDGNAQGGLIKVLVNAELRIPIWWRFGLDLFVDGGILATGVSDFVDEFEAWLGGEGWDYGAELTVRTPLGPIRLYYAVPVSPPGGGELNLGVQYAF